MFANGSGYEQPRFIGIAYEPVLAAGLFIRNSLFSVFQRK
jgi:hypothetical protein